jgi:hypothetical protein
MYCEYILPEFAFINYKMGKINGREMPVAYVGITFLI